MSTIRNQPLVDEIRFTGKETKEFHLWVSKAIIEGLTDKTTMEKKDIDVMPHLQSI